MTTRLLAALAFLALSPLLLGTSNPNHAQARTISPASPNICWDSSCYRTYEQVELFLQNIAGAYPLIASLQDAGTSWEGTRHLWLMRLGNIARPGPRPAIFLVAEQHPRDIATADMLLRYIAYLTQNYDTDPDVTWLLDNRDVWVLPLANPDGYYQIYANSQCNRIKNTDNDDGCTNPANWGTDINRNYPFHWNEATPTPVPCDSSYPGPAALSEPESAHVLSSFQASGASLVVSFQAPGPGIRYPWGWSSTPTADAPALDALAWNLGRLNGTLRANVHQHNTGSGTIITGILDDTVYGQYGVPAYTFYIGSTTGPICPDLDVIWDQQRPALLYATKAVGLNTTTTLSRPFGPAPRNLEVSDGGGAPDTLHFTAVLSSNYGTVEGAVYTIDEPGSDGAGLPMSGSFGGGVVTATASIDTGSLPNGRHLLFVQGKNGDNRWGVHSSVFFTITGNLTTSTPTNTARPTVTFTPTSVEQFTSTASPTYTRTSTRTATGTSTTQLTRTPTLTITVTGTWTDTPTRTPTFTHSPTDTRTPTYTHSPTDTRTPTYTRTPSPPHTITPLPCATYTDVYPGQYFYQAVDWLTCRHAVSGYADGTFRPFNNVTRAQAVKIVVLGEGWPLYSPPRPTFNDVFPADWHYQYIETANFHGIITGYGDGAFRPQNNITRGQLSKVIVLASLWSLLDPEVPHFIDVPRGSTFYTYIETAYAHQIISGYGDGSFRPQLNATRGQYCKMLYVALNP